MTQFHGAKRRTHGASSWRTHGALMAQNAAEIGCEGPWFGPDEVRYETPLGGFIAHFVKAGPKRTSGRSSFMARFMAHSWRKVVTVFMAQIGAEAR